MNDLWKKVDRYGFIFALCPFVKMVAVTNSLAFGTATEKSDIDLFIVAENGHLATARFFMKVLTQIFGMRVHSHKKAGRFCLSFWVIEDAMNLKPIALERDPHLADFVKTAVPVYGEVVYNRWFAENYGWAHTYYNSLLVPKGGEKIAPHPIARSLGFIFESVLRIFGGPLESLLYGIQEKRDMEYMARVATEVSSIVINKGMFKFHEKDPRAEIARKIELQNPRAPIAPALKI